MYRVGGGGAQWMIDKRVGGPLILSKMHQDELEFTQPI